MTQNIQKLFGLGIRACLLLLLVASLQTAQAATITWTGGAGAGNEEWSNFSNFSSAADPSGEDVVFTDTASGGSAATVTNIVDSSVTIGSLTFTKDVLAVGTTFHHTQIDTGQMLTVTGSYVQGLGNPPCDSNDECDGFHTSVTMSGGGTFAFNNGAGTFSLGQFGGFWNWGDRSDDLDMSGLANFTLNANLWEIARAGAASPNSIMTLADTNVVTANTLDIGEWNDTGVLELGRDNTLNIDTMLVAYGTNNAANGTIRFDTGLVNPSVVIRDKAGSGGAIMRISRPNNSSTGLVDLSGGDVDALFDELTVAYAAGGGNSTGTFTFDQGTVIATETNLGIVTGAGNAIATLNINGTGTFSSATVNFLDSNVTTTGNGTSRINMNGGTLRSTLVQAGDDLGAGSKTREINFNSGTVGNISGSDSTISADIALKILTTGTHALDVTSGQTMTINADITGAGTGAVNKTGAGTLLMQGTNTYVAPTNVLAGTIGGAGAATSDFTIAAGATLAPGASAGTFQTNNADLQSGSVLAIEIGGTTAGTEYDQVVASGDVNISGSLVVSFINGFSPSENDVFTILTANSITGQFSGAQLASGQGYFDISYLGNSIQLSNFQVPEPSTFTLLGLSILGCQVMRRRRRRA